MTQAQREALVEIAGAVNAINDTLDDSSNGGEILPNGIRNWRTADWMDLTGTEVKTIATNLDRIAASLGRLPL
jgi:hypothetical protein